MALLWFSASVAPTLHPIILRTRILEDILTTKKIVAYVLRACLFSLIRTLQTNAINARTAERMKASW